MEEVKQDAKCPCCSDLPFSDCCKPFIQGQKTAKTAEQLMRSRYTAFTLADNQYLMDSWAKETRPKEIHTEDDTIQWLSLEIKECENGTIKDTDGFVGFTARFLSGGHLCKLHEKSSFIKEDNVWYYLDGETESETEKVGRNTPCPCGSGKKYKRCCC
ncbi:MAG: SEC-C domain-containing protein [Desulfocapsa sp.]|nr:SEC-C domain-containing protein [Desulfocapsa sp.]